MPTSELVKVPPPKRPVVLKSGGPIMDVVCVEGGNAVCEWEYWDAEAKKTIHQRSLFPLGCLYSCVRFIQAEGDVAS